MSDKKVTHTDDDEGPVLSVEDVAQSLGVSHMSVIRAYRAGQLVGRRKGLQPKSPIVIYQRSVEEYKRKLRGG
jgi:hypothetical protein